ncbi:MAG: enoyl-CoA hydratase/isomerase family protein [Maricaulaceae bacterium]|jgi:enoyl-CoA hydratase/carnithine racemase
MSQDKDWDVAVGRDGFIGTVEMRRPPHNFISVEIAGALADACEQLDADDGCRAIVLSTEGKSFCAGADLRGDAGEDGKAPTDVRTLYGHAVRLFSVKTPMIAAVQGAAIGAGLGLALVADFRVVAPEARFAANFVKLGFHPGFGITHTLPRAVGEQRAALMMLTGRRIKAEEALDWGLADALAPSGAMMEAAKELAAEIAEAAPLAVKSTRATLRAALAEAVRAKTEVERTEQEWLRRTEDFAEGVRAVNERRAGDFKGK